jgi:ATP-dependent Clp protease protease subunit
MDGFNNSLDFYGEWQNYARKHLGISSMQFESWERLQNTIYSAPMTSAPQASMTPYILEERKMNVTQMDIFSRMMMERILWLVGPVNDQMSTVTCAQLLFLSNLDSKTPITCYVDSPGGSVKSGLSMVDTINLISPEVATINTGMAASMGSILLGCGTKGKRSALPNSRVMLHQVSSGAQGHIDDMEISIAEAKKYNERLFEMLGEYSGKSKEEVLLDCNRDNWLNAEEALAYGIIDEVIGK